MGTLCSFTLIMSLVELGETDFCPYRAHPYEEPGYEVYEIKDF